MWRVYGISGKAGHKPHRVAHSIVLCMTPRLTLTVLVDNSAILDNDLLAEPGLSFLLTTAGKKVLFDTGLSGLFLANARKLGTELDDVDTVVLSHGHIDHTGGLPALADLVGGTGDCGSPPPELIAHPRCFWPKEKKGKMNGSVMTGQEAAEVFRLRLSDQPLWITDDLVFLGGIPRKFPFEHPDSDGRQIHLPDETTEPDLLSDDSALAFRSGSGLVIITGCSHSGIGNITEYAREVCGESRVRDIIGGFHLLVPEPERWKKTGGYLASLSLEALHPCHCTSLAAKLALAKTCPVQETGVGMKFTW